MSVAKDELIRILVNGKTVETQSGLKLADLLIQLEIQHPAIAVEMNSEIKTRTEFGSCEIDVIRLPRKRRIAHVNIGFANSVDSSAFVLFTG